MFGSRVEGFGLPILEAMACRTPIIGTPRVFVSHGTEDTVLSVTKTRNTIVPTLRNAGYDVTYREFTGTHSVPADVGEASLDWFLGTG